MSGLGARERDNLRVADRKMVDVGATEVPSTFQHDIAVATIFDRLATAFDPANSNPGFCEEELSRFIHPKDDGGYFRQDHTPLLLCPDRQEGHICNAFATGNKTKIGANSREVTLTSINFAAFSLRQARNANVSISTFPEAA